MAAGVDHGAVSQQGVQRSSVPAQDANQGGGSGVVPYPGDLVYGESLELQLLCNLIVGVVTIHTKGHDGKDGGRTVGWGRLTGSLEIGEVRRPGAGAELLESYGIHEMVIEWLGRLDVIPLTGTLELQVIGGKVGGEGGDDGK